MNDDEVLRTLGEDLAREDPGLAALLGGAPPRRSHRAWFFLALPLVIVLLLLPLTVALGVLALLLVVASPFVGILYCTPPDDGPAPPST
jgi:Protein of unknown function (DUF3040)